MADIKNIETGDKGYVSIYETPTTAGGKCYNWRFQADGKDAEIFVQESYDRVVIREGDKNTLIEMRKCKSKEEGGKPFYIWRTGKWKIALNASKFEEGPEYYPAISLLDAEQIAEAVANDEKYAIKPVDVDFWDDLDL